jgi:hypothetical protein
MSLAEAGPLGRSLRLKPQSQLRKSLNWRSTFAKHSIMSNSFSNAGIFISS